MTWTDLPTDAPVNWADNIGMEEDADFLNKVGEGLNSTAAWINAFVNGVDAATVLTAESTSSLTYADLATTTDAATVTVGASGIVIVSVHAALDSGAATTTGFMSFAMTGANTRPADDVYATWRRSTGAAFIDSIGDTFVLTDLLPGATTFKAKYRRSLGTPTFSKRRISAIAFP